MFSKNIFNVDSCIRECVQAGADGHMYQFWAATTPPATADACWATVVAARRYAEESKHVRDS
jgi:hypothetical protein